MRSKLRLGLLQESFADEPFDFDVDHLRVLLVRFAAKQDFKSATTGVAAKAMRNELNALVSGIDDPAVRKVSLLSLRPTRAPFTKSADFLFFQRVAFCFQQTLMCCQEHALCLLDVSHGIAASVRLSERHSVRQATEEHLQQLLAFAKSG